MNEILEWIAHLLVGDGIIIAVAAFVVGEVVKKIEVIDNKYIPLIGAVLGMVLGAFIPHLFEGEDLISSAIMGMALGWAATGGYETIKNLTRRVEE